MSDGQFIVNDRTERAGTPTPPAARPFGLSRSPAPAICTPDDPFGRGNDGAAFREASPWSKTEQEMRAAQDKSASELGEAMLGPVLKAAEWSPPGRAAKLAVEVADIVQTLRESGTMGLAGKTLRDLAIKQATKALEKKYNLPEGTSDLLGNAIDDAIKLGSGGPPAPPMPEPICPIPAPPSASPKPKVDDNYKDGSSWASRRPEREQQDQIQQGVDRQEQRAREDPGVMIA